MKFFVCIAQLQNLKWKSERKNKRRMKVWI